MKYSEIATELIRKNGLKYSVLGARMGMSGNAARERSLLKNPSIKKMIELLRLMDYKVQIVQRETRTPKDGYELECSEEE